LRTLRAQADGVEPPPRMKTAWRLLYLAYRLVSGLRYWTRRRFTTPGRTVLVLLLVTAIMGSDTENNLGYQAFSLLFFLVLPAVCASAFFRLRFSAGRQLPRFGTVGRPFHYQVRVQNRSKKIQFGLVLLEDLADPRPSFDEWRNLQIEVQRQVRSFRLSQGKRLRPFQTARVREAELPPLGPGEETEVSLELTPLRRGALRFTGVRLARPDPLGLFRAFARIPLPQTAIILPRRYLLPPIPLPGALKYQEGGVALAANVGQSEEFVALRDYRHGDPLRHIHWRSWAKAGKPVVKEFEDEFFVRHALVLDTFSPFQESDVFEEAVSVAASFACTIQSQESLLDLLFVGPQSYCFTSGRGLAHTEQILEVLASVRPCQQQTFATLEHLVLNHVSLVSGCVCVLLAWDDQRREFVKKLQTLGVPLLVLVVVPPGATHTLDPGPMAEQPERFHVLAADKIEAGLAALR
jgi:uncharacterized protein (DUF58 family)